MQKDVTKLNKKVFHERTRIYAVQMTGWNNHPKVFAALKDCASLVWNGAKTDLASFKLCFLYYLCKVVSLKFWIDRTHFPVKWLNDLETMSCKYCILGEWIIFLLETYVWPRQEVQNYGLLPFVMRLKYCYQLFRTTWMETL